jgi:hypothetical protein
VHQRNQGGVSHWCLTSLVRQWSSLPISSSPLPLQSCHEDTKLCTIISQSVQSNLTVSYNILLVYDSALRDEVVSNWIAGSLCESTLDKKQKGRSLWIQHIEAEGHGSNLYLDNVDREEFIKQVYPTITLGHYQVSQECQQQADCGHADLRSFQWC